MNKQKIDLENNKILRSDNICHNNQSLKDYLDKGTVYSNEEQKIGKWIDKKPIYQKVVQFEIGDNSNKFVPYNISNVDNIWIDESASYIMGDSETLPINWYYATSDWCRVWANKNSGEIRFRSPSTLGARIGYVCLRYTKTTD